ncbi:MAG: SIS domain-containing protein [Caulobacteraceae bacterium]|nr:SIS domain-containing protein [Caulobacteraceae bacterium]
MFAEAAQAPAVVRAQLAGDAAVIGRLAERLRAAPPRAVITLGRGSSDHATTYARYLIETRLGIITGSAAPSVTSLYDSAPGMAGTLCLAVSQSGRSPDLLAAAQAAKAAGGLVVALVNDEASPLATLADVTVPLKAGPELSVAATKSYIGALSAIAQIVAHWTGDDDLTAALAGLPELLERAWALDWSAALPYLIDARSLYVVARGVGFAIAQEAALKFKETCGVHAEAFSAAEVLHGPMALVGPGFPVLAFVQDDETREGVEAMIGAGLRLGAEVLQVGGAAQAGARALPGLAAHPVLQPIAGIQSFYRLVNALAVARGFDPDRPPHLAKVTETT